MRKIMLSKECENVLHKLCKDVRDDISWKMIANEVEAQGFYFEAEIFYLVSNQNKLVTREKALLQEELFKLGFINGSQYSMYWEQLEKRLDFYYKRALEALENTVCIPF